MFRVGTSYHISPIFYDIGFRKNIKNKLLQSRKVTRPEERRVHAVMATTDPLWLDSEY